jgi:hypothetical protein
MKGSDEETLKTAYRLIKDFVPVKCSGMLRVSLSELIV